MSWTIRAPNEETDLVFSSSWESSFVVVVSPKLLKDRFASFLFVSGTMTSSGWFSSRRRTNAGNPLGTRALIEPSLFVYTWTFVTLGAKCMDMSPPLPLP